MSSPFPNLTLIWGSQLASIALLAALPYLVERPDAIPDPNLPLLAGLAVPLTLTIGVLGTVIRIADYLVLCVARFAFAEAQAIVGFLILWSGGSVVIGHGMQIWAAMLMVALAPSPGRYEEFELAHGRRPRGER